MKVGHRITLRMLALAAALPVLTFAIAPAALAIPPEPTYGIANVDGVPGEWNLTTDFFANMHRAGQADKPIEAKLYLRYNCLTGTMYALILTVPGVPALAATPGTAWIAIDAQNNKVVLGSSGDDGNPPDFRWVGLGYDGNATHAMGYEASFQISQGSYEIIAHVNVFDAGGSQTGGTIGFPQSGPDLLIICRTVAVEPTTWSRIKLNQRD